MFYTNQNNNHQLIQREQTYVLDRKLVTFHAMDRDICKWPNVNHFEIELPEAITDVQSMRLIEIEFPANYYTFSNNNQNTTFLVNISNGLLPPTFINVTITIQEGFYTPDELAYELTNKLNQAVAEARGGVYTNFTVYYDKVGQRFWFGNTTETFTLLFLSEINYDVSNCEIHSVYHQYSRWGFPWYVGFDKKNYAAIQTSAPITFDYNPPGHTSWLSAGGHYVKAPSIFRLFGENTIYMEVDKYNNIDELYPYSESTNTLYNNDYNGKVNAAFAKIPVICTPHKQIFETRSCYLQNVVHFDPVIERIQKLKFKFRNHDNMLIDFQGAPLNFTIEFNRLKNEIGKAYDLRVPALYNL